MLSVWVLYSIMVLGGRFKTRRRVSLIRAVVAWSLAVLFQMEMMSSYRWKAERACLRITSAVRDGIKQRHFRLWVLPGSVLTPRPRRSPLLPWTAPRAWPGSSSPSTETPGLSSDGWSTFHPSYWHHPEHNSSRSSQRASRLRNQTDSMHNKMSTHLPHGFNTLLEEVEVTMARQVAWPDHMTIETPELLHLEKKKKCLH